MGSVFWFIPLTFVLLLLSTSLLNIGNIIKDKPIMASDYSVSYIMIWLLVAAVLEFVYLFLDKFLSGVFG